VGSQLKLCRVTITFMVHTRTLARLASILGYSLAKIMNELVGKLGCMAGRIGLTIAVQTGVSW
jgi:hypothetical protein